MDLFTEEEWMEFAELVHSIGILYQPEAKKIRFRSHTALISRGYVMIPANDALKVAELLDENPELMEDSGLFTVLPIAKCVEMHLRLLYLGEDPSDFQNKQFRPSAALSSICNWMGNQSSEPPSHKGHDGKPILAKGKYFLSFTVSFRGNWEDVKRFISLARKIYRNGNKYRHNQIQSWEEVRPIYVNQLELFNEFKGLFDKLAGLKT